MGWTAPSGHVFTTSEVVTAATMNTYIKDNLLDLDRRATATSAAVATQEGTTTLTYVALATAGPAVTVTTGTLCLVILYSLLTNNTAGDGSAMSFDVSGATTTAAADAFAVVHENSTAGKVMRVTAVFNVTLTAGSNTFTAKYRAITGGTATFADRKIIAIPLKSA